MKPFPKSKVKGILILTLMLLLPSLPLSHAIYTAQLQSSTIFADDFEQGGYSNGLQTRNLASGWGYVDNATGGSVHINTTNYQSCCHSLSLTSPTAGGAKFDIDKRIARNNSTRQIQLSLWFAISANMPGDGSQSDFHVAIEQWDRANHFESLIEFNYLPLSGVTCVRPDIFAGVADTVEPYCLEPYDNSGNTFNRQYWHHLVIQSDVVNHRFLYCEVDAISYSACQNTDHDITPDTTFQNQYFINLIRFEMAVFNKGTAPATPYFVWFDNIQISDITPGPSPVIQFGITLLSGWFPILVASIALLYTTSGIGLIRRVWFNKTEGILSSYRTIVATGMIATIGFIVLLAIGALLTQQVCSNLPQGTATCSY